MIIIKYRINTSYGYIEFAEKGDEYHNVLSQEGISEEEIHEEVTED